MRAFQALLSALWRYADGNRKVVILYIVLFACGNTVWLFEPYVIGKILNAVQESGENPSAVSSILRSLAMLVSLSAGFWLFHGPARILERTNAFLVRRAFKQHLFSVITDLPLQWHKNHHSGQTINRISKATSALFNFTQDGYQLIEMIVRPLGALVALTILFPVAAFVAIVSMSAACGIVFFFDRILLPLYDRLNEKDHFVASALHDYITNITTVITLRLEKLTQSELYKRMTNYFPVYRRECRLNEGKWFIATMAISITTALILGGYAVTQLKAGAVPLVGTFFMLYEYLQRIGGAFYMFAWKYSQVVAQYADLKSVDPILEADQAEKHLHCSIDPEWETIEIKNLSFTYKDEERPLHHLKNISVTLQRGKRIAFVGESGSGKSTLMSLIRGLHEADSGEIVCDGKILAHGLKDVGSTVTLIPQEPEIFENTIEYNITLDTDQEASELLEDVELSRFASVVARLPQGLKTNTAEKGVNLSGGEKQRLALARGFFAAKRSSIILLDEPTSSVDPVNERHIYENMIRRFSDRCIVSALHKRYLLPLFDYVYVFESGTIVDQGTPTEVGPRLRK
ncbi:ABC transporter ATP-binding protein [Candidatus Peribacteria bacterium]|nr:ABC transporter ATP-binding protein [Candidatus Peribacteria bacterium]